MADLAAVMALYSESGLDVPDLAAQVAALRREVLALKDAVQGLPPALSGPNSGADCADCAVILSGDKR